MQRLFTYPDFGTPNNYPDYTQHSGQLVEVLREVEHAGDIPERLYAIRASDGWEGQAWESELSVNELKG